MKQARQLSPGVALGDIAFGFWQPNDSCEEEGEGQRLALRFEDSGGGKFLILKTKRWALDLDQVPRFCQNLLAVCQFVDSLKEGAPLDG